jgi:hypothetical protein
MNVKSVVSKLFARFTKFDPDLLKWIEAQESEARSEVTRIRRQNAIEAEIMRARKEARHVHP